jgi:putative hydrolase
VNEGAAKQLRAVAEILAGKEASPYRVRAWRRAADVLEACDEPLELLLERGSIPALPDLDHALLRELASTGHLDLLDRLRGRANPVALFCRLPGIGPKLAKLLHDALQADSLEALAAAAKEGRLESVPGVGPRRARAIRLSLEEMLRPGSIH